MATIDADQQQDMSNYEENETLILDMLDRFLKTEVKPYVHELDAKDEYPHEIVEKMKDMGLFGCLISPEYGGSVSRLRRTRRSSIAFPRYGCR